MEIKHLDITNRNLLKKVLNDCNYTNERKAARLKLMIEQSSFPDQSSAANYSYLDNSSIGMNRN